MAAREESEIHRTLTKTLTAGSNTTQGIKTAADDFALATAKVAVAQLCEAAGFHGTRDSALESFADITIRYLIDLGKTAEFFANLSGRSQCCVFDLIQAWQDLEAPRGFSGGVSEIINYMESAPEVPFAQPIPHFPVIRERRRIPSFEQMGETPPSKNIPHWLPALPDPHTYIYTPVWDEKVSDPRDDKIEQARQRRKAERSLLSLQKRLLLCNRNRNGNLSADTTINTTSSVNVDEEEDVAAPIVLQSKISGVDGNRVSVLEAFAPAIEMLGSDGGLCGDDGLEGEKMLLPAVTARPTVHFKFRTGKKLIGESLDARHQKKDALQALYLAGREDERDDKKRRAEYILRQSLENPQELTLL